MFFKDLTLAVILFQILVVLFYLFYDVCSFVQTSLIAYIQCLFHLMVFVLLSITEMLFLH